MHYLAVGPECAASSLCGSENFLVKLDGGICVGSNKIRRDRVISFWNFLHCGTHWGTSCVPFTVGIFAARMEPGPGRDRILRLRPEGVNPRNGASREG